MEGRAPARPGLGNSPLRIDLDPGSGFPDVRAVPSPFTPTDVLRSAGLCATLRQCRFFATLPIDDLEAVVEGCFVQQLAKGETLFREGERATGFYVVRSGAVSINRVTPDGREQIICVFHPTESFAEITLATTETYPGNAVALENSQVILVRKETFVALVRRKPEMALRMLGSMSTHLKHLVQLLQDLKGRQVEARLADWLLRHSPAAAAGCPAVIDLAISKKVLAGQLGVTSETLSRTFARFRDEGVLAVSGPKVSVKDGRRLKAFAEGRS